MSNHLRHLPERGIFFSTDSQKSGVDLSKMFYIDYTDVRLLVKNDDEETGIKSVKRA